MSEERATHMLLHAAFTGQVSLLTSAIRDGADVNAVTDDGNTPLHTACRFANMGAVKALLHAPEINVNPVNNHQRTPMDIAATSGRKDLKDILQEHGAKTSEELDIRILQPF